MMDYYLPMTVKLLEIYKDMDSQPVQGETIRNSTKEIENTLDHTEQCFCQTTGFCFSGRCLGCIQRHFSPEYTSGSGRTDRR